MSDLTLDRILDIRLANECRIGDPLLNEADATSAEVVALCNMVLSAQSARTRAGGSVSVLNNLSPENRKIVDEAMQNHDKHYRGLVFWIERRRKRIGKKRSMSGPGMLSEMLGTGHTVACCIWEKYGGNT